MKQSILILSTAAIGVGLMGFSAIKRDPTVLYNPSESAPIGWYRIETSRHYGVGDRVAVWLPEQAEKLAVQRGYLPRDIPVIKTIYAGPGDTYCVRSEQLFIGEKSSFDILTSDSNGREMPVLPVGCRSLNKQEYLVLSDRVGTSFDGRYFGPVGFEAILGNAVFIGATVSNGAPEYREQGGARGSGAEGKIKGEGAKQGLMPCLHIDFYSAIYSVIAPSGRGLAHNYYCSGQRQFLIDHDPSPDVAQ